MKLEIKKENKKDIEIIKLIGSLDGSTAPLVQEQVVQNITEKSKIVLDMSECTYVSSAGLRILMITAKTLKSKGGKGVLANLIDEVEDVIKMTGFDNIFNSVATTSEAIKYIQGEA